MPRSPSEKHILITGAGSGIGGAAALRFAREGAMIGLLSHTDEELSTAAADVEERGARAEILVADVSDEEAMAAAVTAFGEAGSNDVAIVNAGKADDVAGAISFLASDAARHVTGSLVFVDGAQSLLR